jgi:hypothetical protein
VGKKWEDKKKKKVRKKMEIIKNHEEIYLVKTNGI